MECIFNDLHDWYNFIESETPDYILFGPYGNDIPAKGKYTRIGYFCENIKPDLSLCEWAFGVPSETEINHPKYKRIQWHGLDPQVLIKPEVSEADISKISSKKTRFCNFIYSHKVSYREAFFKQLSKYKQVDAPGKSMTNMPSFDDSYTGSLWERKRAFMSEYKFTIAFENYSYPGYQTEKLYDAMQVNSIPIYCGDPLINETFNTKSFINAHEYINSEHKPLVNWLERNMQIDFVDMRPAFYKSPYHRIKRKIKETGRNLKMNLQFSNLNFSRLIERIIELDQDDDLYLSYLQQPWFHNNSIPERLSSKERWKEIFG